jgi:hypothetical protein
MTQPCDVCGHLRKYHSAECHTTPDASQCYLCRYLPMTTKQTENEEA